MNKIQFNVIEYLERSAKTHPHKLAFGDERREYTFNAFRNAAMSVGMAISERTGDTGKPVVVFVDRDVFCLVGMMGVLYSGNYYVPIDNKMPKKRIDKLFKNLNPELIIYREEDSDRVMDLSCKYDLMSIEEALTYERDQELLEKRRSKVLDVDPAYVIYTSGSTGEPKGIVVSHKALIDFVEWIAECCELDEKNVYGNQAPFHFDTSVKDIFLTMKCAGRMYVIPDRFFKKPAKLMDYLDYRSVNTLLWSTAAFNYVAGKGNLEKRAPCYVKKLAIGGEAMRAKNLNIWRRALPKAQIYNIYGPAETVVDCTYYKVDREFLDHEAVPIGKACENKEIILLNDDLKPVRDGESGEICVRGTGLANGYYGDFEKTRESFIQNPLNDRYPDLLYRTGDIGRINDRGELVFHSRIDGQIKHLGYRMELGEVEQIINSVKAVNDAVCIYNEKTDKIICFYEGMADEKEIQKNMRSIMPQYMFPEIYIKLDIIPYNGSGKVDRLKLTENYDNNKYEIKVAEG